MTPSPPTEKERRVFPRVPVSGRASVRVVGKSRVHSGQLINLSRSGVLLETDPLSVGTRVRTQFLEVNAVGTVVRRVAGRGADPSRIAVEFDELQNPDWKAIRSLRD